MKKLVSLLSLVLIIALAITATAETVDPELVIPKSCTYEGSWLNFTDNAFYMYAPTDWQVMQELDQKVIDAGIISALTNADKTQSLSIAWTEVPEELTVEQIKEQITAAYTEVDVATINGVDFVSYTDASNNGFGAVCLDPNYYGMYTFHFTPIDEATQTIALGMLLSINFYTPAE